MNDALNPWLFLGAVLSVIASLLHVAIVVRGAPWYRFFGAGERMARMAEAGQWYPGALTMGIALVLFAWGAYALAGAGWVGWGLAPGVLPWPKPVLCLITAAYGLRGLTVIPLLLFAPAQVTPFVLWSSVICSGYGAVHVLGLVQVWERL